MSQQAVGWLACWWWFVFTIAGDAGDCFAAKLTLNYLLTKVLNALDDKWIFRLIAEQAERSLRDQQSLLNRKEADLRAADNHIQLLEDQLEALKRSSQLDRDEISKLRSAIADLDHEKDDLQMAIDEKTEAEAKKTESISSKVVKLCNISSSVLTIIIIGST